MRLADRTSKDNEKLELVTLANLKKGLHAQNADR
jgi:hypothetical protein